MLHQGFLLAVQWDPEGGLLFSGSIEGALNVWDTATGALESSLQAHGGPVRGFSYADDGTLWSASKDGSVRAWRAQSEIRAFRPAGAGGAFAVDACFGSVASGWFDSVVRVCDGASGELETELRGHTEPVLSIGFLTPELLVTGGRDCSVRVWNLGSGECVHTLEGHRSAVTRVAVLPDGVRAATVAEDGTLRIWDCAEGRLLATRVVPHETPVWGLDVDASGKRAITGAAGATQLWDLESDDAPRFLPHAAFAHRAIAFSPDGRTVALGGDDSHVVLLDVDSGETRRRLDGVSAWVQCTVASPDAKHVVSGHVDGSLVLRAGEDTQTLSRAHNAMVYSALRIGATRYVTASLAGQARIARFGSARPERVLDHAGQIFSIAATADGERLLTVGDDHWILWAVETGRLLARVDEIGSANHTVGTIAKDAPLVLTAGEDDLLRVYDLDGTARAEWPMPRPHVCVIVVLPDAQHALVGDAGGWVCRVDLRDGSGEALYADHEDWIRSLQISDDGRRVLSVSQEGDALLFDLEVGKLVAAPALQRTIGAATWLPSGDAVVITTEGSSVEAPGLASERGGRGPMNDPPETHT